VIARVGARLAAGMLLSWMLLAGCSPDAPPGVVEHPLSQYWSRPGAAVQISGPHTGESTAGKSALVRDLDRLEPVVQIGSLDGAPEQVFGEIVDAALDARGRMIVLDARYNDLRLYDRAGRFIASAGGPGDGPGEFQSPAALALHGDTTVWVLDRRAARVSRFRLQPDGFRFVRSFPVRVSAYDLCAMGGSLFVYGLSAERNETIHRFTTSGKEAGAFGVVYTAPNPLVRGQLLMGRLTCAEADGLVLAMSNFLPEVRGYTGDGILRWRAVLPDHQPIRMDEEPDGVRQGMPAHGRGYHYAASLVAAAPGHAILQMAHLTPASLRSPYPFARLDTYVLDTRTGRGEHAGSDVPLLAYVREHHALSAREDPFPRLTLLADTARAGR
jgi:hypothetical protein